ncbi:MAG: class I SAM-dependent methyltransferase [Clostridia bacterium]|nr:class I SAM-dependent methyltransferase [Clostridia bacterium]
MVDSTINFYNINAKEFYKNTVNADMSANYKKFESHLFKNAHILDAGCGSGRDSLYFLEQGYNIDAFDASEEMVKLSSELTGIEVQRARFDNFNYKKLYDGIWACASLLHIRKEELGQTLIRVASFLKDGGILYTSFKYGNKVYEKDGRYFNCYDEDSFSTLINHVPEFKITEMYITEDVREDRNNEYWLNVILIKNIE